MRKWLREEGSRKKKRHVHDHDSKGLTDIYPHAKVKVTLSMLGCVSILVCFHFLSCAIPTNLALRDMSIKKVQARTQVNISETR